MKKVFNKGDKVYLKSKYGMFYKVIIKSLEGNYAFIEGGIDLLLVNRK